MDKLKLFVADHREAFDADALPAGHAARFEARLGKHRKSRIRLYSLCAFAAAACAALLVVLMLPDTPAVTGPATVAASQKETTQQDIDELRIYYNMQIAEVLAQMEALYNARQTPGTAELLQESKRVLTANYQFEETVLPTLPCSEEALFAMNQHYANSLECMNFMLDRMESINK